MHDDLIRDSRRAFGVRLGSRVVGGEGRTSCTYIFVKPAWCRCTTELCACVYCITMSSGTRHTYVAHTSLSHIYIHDHILIHTEGEAYSHVT